MQWVLPTDQVPRLLNSVDRRGLFQLKPTSVYIRREVRPKEYATFKRTGFLVAPADARIVYAGNL